jgi:PAS domain S-box-containing protein
MERLEPLTSSPNISQNTAQLEVGVDEVGILLQLANGKIQACNTAAELILGFTLEQMQGRDSNDALWQAIHEDGSPFLGETHPISIALSTGRSILGVIMGLYQPNGKLMWLQIDAQPLFQAGETTPWAAVATFRDITAQRPTVLVQPRLPVDLPAQRTVLIVDDCLEDRETFRRYLSQDHRYRYRVLAAETGAEALEIYQQVELDAVLLDYCLPDYEGLELLHIMQQQNLCHVPIVVVTGQGSESLAVQLLKAGAEDYLIKGSMTIADLQAAITDAIDKTELRLRLRQSQERERLVAQIAQQIRQSLDLETILNTTVEEVRQLFDTDRVLIFRFHPDWSGTVIAESVGAEWTSVMSITMRDPCWATTFVRQYQQGRVSAIANIHAAELNPCHVEMLAEFQVQANLVVPILPCDRLWGLLIAHHCAVPRAWQTAEIELLKQLSTHVGTAIQQAELYQRSQIELAERQRIEVELRDSELFVRKILDSTSECVKVLNLDGQLLYMNPGGQAQMGICDFARFALCQWIEFWSGDDRQAAEQAIAIAKTGISSQFEGYCPTVDGRPKWWEVQVSPILDAEGNIERLLSVSRDITSRKESETALKTNHDRTELLYDMVKELLVSRQPLTLIDSLFENLKGLLDLNLYLNYVVEDSPANADCSRMHLAAYGGIEPALARKIEYLSLGQAICGTTAQERQQIVLSDVQNSDDPKVVLIKNLGVTAYSIQPLIAQGQLFGTLSFGSYRRSHFTTDEAELLQALCDQIAIALERANLIDSLQQQTEELRQADRLKDEFLAVLSHELRTPLSPILGWTRLLQTRRFDEEHTRSALATIERNAKLQAQLIEDLLDIAQIMRGKLTLDATTVNLATVISAALETVRLAAEAKQIQFEITIDEQVPPVAGDSGRLQQVVWNLLSNAIKFSDDAGRIQIRLTQVEHHAQVQIIDSGRGINPEFVPHIFEYFRQADGSTTRRFGGLGLGLAIARQLVELHGGTIRAESAGEGYGATLTFQIPGLNAVSSAMSAVSPLPSPVAPLAGICVLIVDDDDDARYLLSLMLEQSGAIVTTASTAAEALQALKHSRPNILLSDIGMPGMDGYELIRAVRISEQGQDLPAIAITAYAGELNQQSAIAAGFQHHIAKPIDADQLILAIGELVGS